MRVCLKGMGKNKSKSCESAISSYLPTNMGHLEKNKQGKSDRNRSFGILCFMQVCLEKGFAQNCKFKGENVVLISTIQFGVSYFNHVWMTCQELYVSLQNFPVRTCNLQHDLNMENIFVALKPATCLNERSQRLKSSLLLRHLCNVSPEASIPWQHRFQGFLFQEPAAVANDVARVVVPGSETF